MPHSVLLRTQHTLFAMLLCSVLLLVVASSARAQSNSFQTHYAASAPIANQAVAHELAGGGYITLSANVNGSTVTKLAADGASLWARQYPLWGLDVLQGTDGSYMFMSDTYMCKLDSVGTPIWTREIGFFPEHLIATTDGQFVIANEHSLIKFDNAGTVLWKRDPFGCDITAIARSQGGGVVAVGESGWNTTDGCVLKFDAVGNMTWSHKFPTPLFAQWRDIVEQSNGDVWIHAWHIDSIGQYGENLARIELRRFNSNGQATAYQHFAHPQKALWYTSMALSGSDHLLLSGATTEYSSPTQSTSRPGMLVLDPNGNLLFESTIYSASADVNQAIGSINPTSDGGAIVAHLNNANPGPAFTKLTNQLVSCTGGTTVLQSKPALPWGFFQPNPISAVANSAFIANISTISSTTVPGLDVQCHAATLPGCSAPWNLNETITNNTNATFSWTGSGNFTEFRVELVRQGSTNTNVYTTTADTLMVSGLLSCAAYDWRVLAHCGNGSWQPSAWQTFGPQTACIEPASVTIDSTWSTGVQFHWDTVNCINSYFVRVALGSNNYATQTVPAPTTSFELNGLLPDTSWQISVYGQCSPQSWSSNAATASFSTPAGCSAPTNVYSTSITNATANLHWTGQPGATGYLIVLTDDHTGVADSLLVSNTDTAIVVEDLLPCSDYSWTVQALCPWPDTATGASGTDLFTTLCQGNKQEHTAASLPDTKQLRAYPSPANETLRVILPTHTGTQTLWLYNNVGAIVQQHGIGTHSTSVEVRVNALPSGLYHVVVAGQQHRYTTRVTIQH